MTDQKPYTLPEFQQDSTASKQGRQDYSAMYMLDSSDEFSSTGRVSGPVSQASSPEKPKSTENTPAGKARAAQLVTMLERQLDLQGILPSGFSTQTIKARKVPCAQEVEDALDEMEASTSEPKTTVKNKKLNKRRSRPSMSPEKKQNHPEASLKAKKAPTSLLKTRTIKPAKHLKAAYSKSESVPFRALKGSFTRNTPVRASEDASDDELAI